MIGPPPGVRVWLAAGPTDMRLGLDGLARLAQEVLGRDPFSGHVFAFRGRRGHLVKLLLWDGQGCASTPSGWIAVVSFGPMRRAARSR